MPPLGEIVDRLGAGPWGQPVSLRPPAGTPEGDARGVAVTGATHDSRQVRPGWLFCAVRGAQADGHGFCRGAVEAGAAALLVDHPLDVSVPQLVVDDTRTALGPAAAAVHGDPSSRLEVIGVTGTNGKTTTTAFLAKVLERAGWPTTVIGTLSGLRTTPEATDLQAALAASVAERKRAVAMEVSSHALALHRVDATRFAVAVFTNLSQDHLDFHGSMERYFRAKARLFEPRFCAQGVVNGDDPYGQLLLAAATVPTASFCMQDAQDLHLMPTGSRFRWRGAAVELHLGATVNVANALAAATAAAALGIDPPTIAAGLSDLAAVPGRFEPVRSGQPFDVVVDYAHTPDALDRVLGSARRTLAGSGRLLVVFGCGGDRDRLKRPAMAQAAARHSDFVVLTSDNPRDEDPLAIIAEARSGLRDPDAAIVEPDRAAAIALAIDAAHPGDLLVIAGKGHETGQEIAGVVHPFDDREVARAALAARGWLEG